MIELKPLTPVAAGHLRLVFDHPHEPDLLIKVMRPEMIEKRWGGPKRWYKRIPRALHYSGFLRELGEYVGLHARNPDGNAPVARTLGIVETDYGIGLVVERVRGPDGRPAPTLETLVRRDGITDAIRAHVATLHAELERYNVIVGDMHPGNLVYGADSRGGPRLVLIDGFGEKNVFPRNTLSRWMNQRHLRGWRARLARKLARLV